MVGLEVDAGEGLQVGEGGVVVVAEGGEAGGLRGLGDEGGGALEVELGEELGDLVEGGARDGGVGIDEGLLERCWEGVLDVGRGVGEGERRGDLGDEDAAFLAVGAS